MFLFELFKKKKLRKQKTEGTPGQSRINNLEKLVRAVPFKSTWEEGTPFFYFSVGCGGEIIFFYVGWVFFSIGGGSEISGIPPPRYI